MSLKFQNKYRITTTRLQSWDYASQGMYFITICTKDRLHFFGEINNGEMNFSEIGKIVETEWIKTPEIRFDMNLELGEFVIMPNHFHAIIIIGKNEYNTNTNSIPNPNIVIGRGAMHCASTNDDGVPTDDGDNGGNQFGPQSKNLASIIRGFKSSVTTYARKNNLSFNWQPRFHDHIIRSMNDYHRISNYILTNPQNWNEDSFNNIQDV